MKKHIFKKVLPFVLSFMLASSTVFAADYDAEQENISVEETIFTEEAVLEEIESEEIVSDIEEISEDVGESEESNPEEEVAESIDSGSLNDADDESSEDILDDEHENEESLPGDGEGIEEELPETEATDSTETGSSDEADDLASEGAADAEGDNGEPAEAPSLEESDEVIEEVNLSAEVKTIKSPSFAVKGVFNGRRVTFNSDYAGARIYYSTTTSNITLNDASALSGESVIFNSFYGTVYARVYVNGVWSGPSRLILKIPTVNTPTISLSGDKIKISTTTPDCYISYTTDGSTPSETNGTIVSGSTVLIPRTAGTIKAVALRSCFTNSGVSTISVKPAPPTFAVQGVFGGRNVTFSSTDTGAKIYYSTSTSNITTSDFEVLNGGTKLFEDYYGTIYAKSYCNGMWSNVARLILRIPVVNTPTITLKSNVATIATTTPLCYIVYTTDGTTPSLTNGTRVYGGNGSKITVTVPVGSTIKAMAIRNCFTNSSIVSKT
ncbi:MAG: chitobiase/beta-hexosaminidase C-terminal domain-containing protein, partial [Acetatifactor sp.]|nr:chitobiase/beta-hexosaminidase C-terminal domain-containing protein [Acetatifactor sp.]